MFILTALLLAFTPLDEAMLAIDAVPECSQLLEQVSKEGGFALVPNSKTSFEAQWNSETRAIEVNLEKHSSLGHIITSVLFELHNALSDNQLQNLYESARNRLITKEMFVRKIEELEWKNWESTRAILKIGRDQGLFPREASLPAFQSFSDYLRIQHQTGHSQYHAETYDIL